MLKIITDKLKSASISAWQVRLTEKTSFQSFLALSDQECAREVQSIQAHVAIFLKTDDGMGMANFTVVPQTLPAWETWLENAILSAKLTKNQSFELPPQPAESPRVELCDTSLGQHSLPALQNRLLSAVAQERNIRLSSAEFFIDRIRTKLENSHGLSLEQEETQLHTEFILLSKNDGPEREFIDRYTRRFSRDFDLENEVSRSSQMARDSAHAELPRTGDSPVVFSEEPLDHLFNPLLARASARLKYNRMLDVGIGKNILDEPANGDAITLWMNNLIPGAAGSFQFDYYGTPAQRICLIEKNIVKNLIADQRYAEYEKVPVTGDLGNLEVEPGSAKFLDLIKPEGGKILYHITALSAFEPNAITGAFSAEIRAGTEISPKGTRPIKGGSVSGILQRDLRTCVLSSERVQRERHLVPQGILFKRLDIAGR